VESFAERPAKTADRADAAAGFGNGRCNRSASRGIPEKTIAAGKRNCYAYSRQSGMCASRALTMHCGRELRRTISQPANFAESSISTLSHFLNLSVAGHAFSNLAPIFF
jgi:hypothetical protein